MLSAVDSHAKHVHPNAKQLLLPAVTSWCLSFRGTSLRPVTRRFKAPQSQVCSTKEYKSAQAIYEVPAGWISSSIAILTCRMLETAINPDAMIPAALFLAIAIIIAYIVKSVRTYLALRPFGGHW